MARYDVIVPGQPPQIIEAEKFTLSSTGAAIHFSGTDDVLVASVISAPGLIVRKRPD